MWKYSSVLVAGVTLAAAIVVGAAPSQVRTTATASERASASTLSGKIRTSDGKPLNGVAVSARAVWSGCGWRWLSLSSGV